MRQWDRQWDGPANLRFGGEGEAMGRSCKFAFSRGEVTRGRPGALALFAGRLGQGLLAGGAQGLADVDHAAGVVFALDGRAAAQNA